MSLVERDTETLSNTHSQPKHSTLGDVLNKVNLGDCLDLMKSMPANSVQTIFADPPFNLNKKYTTYKDNLALEEYFNWTKCWIKEGLRVLKPDGSFFIYNIPRLLIRTSNILSDYAHFRHWIAWQSVGRPLGKTLQPSHYGILFYTKTDKSKFYDVRAPHKKCPKCDSFLKDYGGKAYLRHDFGYQVGDVWDDIHRVRHKNKRILNHPCQLPVHLIERVILISTDPNDIVLDIFAGGGSAAVAAKQLGRQYIGADIDPDYCRAANKKMSEAQKTQLGDIFVSMHLGKIISLRNVDI